MRSIYVAIGCLLLFLPTLHPWYLVLMVPFLVFYPSKAWLYLTVAIVFTFPVMAVEFETGIYQEIFWAKYFEYIPFYGLLIWGLFRDGYLFQNKPYHRPQCISAIIPTLNESESLEGCLQNLCDRTALTETIVADGGSTDETKSIAKKYGATVVECRKGRGFQIKKGLEIASGDVIIILHADCVALQGVFNRILNVLESNSYVVGGAFAMEFEHQNAKTRLISFLNNARTFMTGISFGDQAQFFRKESLADTGGFPSVMLMEDVELSLRLKEIGRTAFLANRIVVSGRRWEGNGFARSLRTVIFLFTRYLIERRFLGAGVKTQHYYNTYYSAEEFH
jgi:rSAM/selenodomain-associated transferase 2